MLCTNERWTIAPENFTSTNRSLAFPTEEIHGYSLPVISRCETCVLDWYKECILRVGSAGETAAILVVHPFPLFLLHLTIIAIKAHLFLDFVQNGAHDARRL